MRLTENTVNLAASKLFIPKKIMTWPDVPIRRASVNSFGFGGANAHVILEEPKGTLGVGWSRTHVLSQGGEPQAHDFSSMKVGTASKRLYTMVFSAAAEEALRAYYTRLKRHLADMNVKVRPSDLAYTLSQRRTHHSCRAYAVTSASNLNRAKVEFGEKPLERPRMAFVFTGQGSQWPQMGAGLVQAFPCAAKRLQYLDTVLQSTSLPPSWSLIRTVSLLGKPSIANSAQES
jgi:acyl transferase domain-containing protein